MNENPSITEVFGELGKVLSDTAPVFALLCRAVAADPDLGSPALASGAPRGRADTLMTAVSLSLRERPHRLAGHLPTFGGTPGDDADIVRDFTELVRDRRDALTAACATGMARWNDPIGSAVFHAAFTQVAAGDDRPLALVELGAAAGLVMRPDDYGYDYRRVIVGGDRPLVLPIELRGETPAHLDTPLRIATRVAIDRDPLDVTDPAHLAWMRASIRFDRAEQLDRLDRAVAIAAADPPTWAVGDLVDILPEVLDGIPGDHLPVVYGSNVLCCLKERRSRIPEIFAAVGRDMVWISQERPANALALIGETGGHEKNHALITTVAYTAGRITDATVMGETGWSGEWLHWRPQEVTLTN